MHCSCIVHGSLHCHPCFLFKDKNLTLILKIEVSVKCPEIYLTLLPIKLETDFQCMIVCFEFNPSRCLKLLLKSNILLTLHSGHCR